MEQLLYLEEPTAQVAKAGADVLAILQANGIDDPLWSGKAPVFTPGKAYTICNSGGDAAVLPLFDFICYEGDGLLFEESYALAATGDDADEGFVQMGDYETVKQRFAEWVAQYAQQGATES